MMKKLVALLMALALLCTSVGTFAEEETVEEPVVAAAVEAEEEEETEEVPAATPEEPESEEPESEEPAEQEPNPAYKAGDYTEQVYMPDQDFYSQYKDHNKDHKYAWEDTKHTQVVSCTEDGIRYFICAICGTPFEVKTADALGHEDEDPTNVGYKEGDEPACFPDGSTKDGLLTHYTCIRCDVKEWTSTVPGAHDFGEAKEIAATCTTNKKLERTCSKCGYVQLTEIPNSNLPHVWDREIEYTPEYVLNYTTATCVSDGSVGKVEICECGETRVVDTMEVVKSVDHVTYLKETQAPAIFTIGEDGYAELTEAYASDEDYEKPIKAVDLESYGVTDSEGNPIYKYHYGALSVKYVAPTCTEEGSIVVSCTEGCPATVSAPIEALGHAYGNGTKLDEAGVETTDCTKAASTLYVCSRCGDRFIVAETPNEEHVIEREADGNFVNEVDHYEQQKVTDKKVVKITDFDEVATCIPYTAYVQCLECEVVVPVKVEPTPDQEGNPEHKNKQWIVNNAPTCTVDGLYIYICKDCGLTVRDTEPATDHSYVIDTAKEQKAPTCTTVGVRNLICSNGTCGQTKTEDIPMIDHVYKSVKVDPADCGSGTPGIDHQRCIMCGKPNDVEIPATHTPPQTGVRQHPASCEEQGWEQYECTECGKTVTVYSDPTGHSWEYSENNIENEKIGFEAFKLEHEANICTYSDPCTPATCKEGAESASHHVVTCAVCGQKKEWDADDKPTEHSMFDDDGNLTSNFSVDYKNLPTCSAPGKAVYQCTVCGDYAIAELAPIGHNYQAKYNAETGAYELVCTPVTKDETGTGETIVRNLLTKAEYNTEVAEKVIEALFSTGTGEEILGIGCGLQDEVIVKKTEYTIAGSEDGMNGQIKLVDNALGLTEQLYVNITWGFEATNGDTVSFTACNFALPVEGETNTYSFNLFGLQVPDSYKLVYTWCEVVTDPRANQKHPGQYDVYGSGAI